MNTRQDITNPSPTVGLLYPGEMGTALATLLLSRGVNVVTTLQDRSEGTARRCRALGITVLDSIAEVVRTSSVAISVVATAAAEQVAETYSDLAHLAPADALYVDMNSTGPDLAVAMSARLADCRRGFVDGAVNGLAKTVGTGGTMFLSGPRAAEVAGLFGDSMRVSVLGDEPGRASAMKMLLSGFSKGVCALFVEAALVARQQGMLNEMTDAYSRIYPGVMAVVQRMLPTYPQHAGRRAEEMRELEQTALSAGLEPMALEAIRRVHEELAAADFGEPDDAGWTVTSVIDRLAAAGVLGRGAGVAACTGVQAGLRSE